MGSLLLPIARGGGCLVVKMSRIQRLTKAPARKSPLLLSSCKTNERLERQRTMMRLSLKKLKKIGDSGSLLHKTVLISNIVERLRKRENTRNISYPINTDRSHYSPEEEEIFNSIKLPPPITPIRDAHDNTEDDMNTTESNCHAGGLTHTISQDIAPNSANTWRGASEPSYQGKDEDTKDSTAVECFYKNLKSFQYIIAG